MNFRAIIFPACLLACVSIVFAATSGISGRVIASTNSTRLIRAEVWLNGTLAAHSDIDGRFTVTDAKAGDILRLRKTDFVDTSTIVGSSEDFFEFELAPIWKLDSAHQIYEDVPDDAWFEPAVRKLYETQTLTASTKQLFLPSETLTRGELAVLSVKVAGFLPDPVTETHFCDIASDDDFAPAVEFMFKNNWISGYQSSTCKKGKVFRPNLPVNRAEAIKMALIAFQDLVAKKIATNVCLPAGFADIPREAWFAKFIDEANCFGFANGYRDGSFRPANPVNRAEIAVILANALESLF
ncbi:MAG: S-layer homology domain-containing protein [Patescibacteria group bacterium]